MYYSPCYAGCHNSVTIGKKKVRTSTLFVVGKKMIVASLLLVFLRMLKNKVQFKISGSERFTRWLEGSEGEPRVCGVFNELSRTSRFMLKSHEISLKTPQTLCSFSLPFTPFRSPLLPLPPSLPLLPFAPLPLPPTEVVGTLKPSIQYTLFPFTSLFPLAPTEVVGTLKPSIQYALLPFAPLCSLCSSSPSHPLPPQRWWGP